MKEIAPKVDVVIDFHTGSAQRSNIAQIRCVLSDAESVELAHVFDPPFIVHSNYISKSVREAMNKMGKKILLFEGGKTKSLDEIVVEEGLLGIQRVLNYYGMRSFKLDDNGRTPIVITSSKWLRAANAGVLRVTVSNGDAVEKGDILGLICDPFGNEEKKIKSPMKGYIICVNEAPLVNKGDAVFHIGKAGK
jgi:predicted deacylase